MPASDVVVIATSASGNARMIAHKTKGFVFVGDGGPFAASASGSSSYSAPAKFTTTNGVTTATSDNNVSPAGYNSYLFLNTIAWAIDYIKTSTKYP